MTMILSGRLKSFAVLRYSNGNGVHTFCIHRSCYYMSYDFEWKTEIFRKYGSHIATGTVYHILYTPFYVQLAENIEYVF